MGVRKGMNVGEEVVSFDRSGTDILKPWVEETQCGVSILGDDSPKPITSP